MQIIGYGIIRRFIAKHPDSAASLNTWYKTALTAAWSSIVDVRRTYPHADAAGRCTVFNISGNKYRLITKIDYRAQVILVTDVLTHAEYDKEKWKKNCQA